jgi:hypothetical protein
MTEEIKPAELSEDAREAAKPFGDFIAVVASAICVLFCFLDFYVPDKTNMVGEVYKGFNTPYGLIILIVAGLCFIFASAVMFAKFFDKDFWLARSPGWLYMATAGVILVVSIMAMIFPYKGSADGYTVEYVSMVGTFFTGLFIAFGGLLKF